MRWHQIKLGIFENLSWHWRLPPQINFHKMSHSYGAATQSLMAYSRDPLVNSPPMARVTSLASWWSTPGWPHIHDLRVFSAHTDGPLAWSWNEELGIWTQTWSVRGSRLQSTAAEVCDAGGRCPRYWSDPRRPPTLPPPATEAWKVQYRHTSFCWASQTSCLYKVKVCANPVPFFQQAQWWFAFFSNKVFFNEGCTFLTYCYCTLNRL